MQTDLPAAFDHIPQRRARRRPAGGPGRAQLVLIVDQQEVPGSLPGRAVEQLLLGQAGRRKSLAEQGGQFGDGAIDVLGGVGVGPHVRPPDPADQGRLGVDDGDLGLLGRHRRRDRLPDCRQGRRLAASLPADDQQVGHLPGRQHHRLQVALADGERRAVGGGVAGDDVPQGDPVGQPHQAFHPAQPRRGGDHRAHLAGGGARTVPAGQLRNAGEQLMSGPGDPESGAVGRLTRRATVLDARAHLGLVGIAQAQLHPGVGHIQQGLLLADQPAAGTGHHVHAVGQALSGDRNGPVAEAAVEVVEVAEVVDDEEDVRSQPAPAELRHVHLVTLEERLAGSDQALDRGHDPRDPVAVGRTDDAGDVRDVRHGVQGCSHAVEGHPVGAVHQRCGGDQRHQRGRLAPLRGRDHHHVVQFGVHGVDPLRVVLRTVHHPGREDQSGIVAVVLPPRFAPPASHQGVGGLADLQWRQPDPVGRACGVRRQRLTDHVQQLFLLESVRVVEELLGLGRVPDDRLAVLLAERLVLPGERSRPTEGEGDRSVGRTGCPGYHEGCRDVAAAELFEFTRADFEQGVTVLLRRQVQRGIASDHVPGVLRGFGPQGDPERDVALRLAQRGQVQALAAEREEDVAPAALLADVDDQVDPVGMVMKQFEILVDDDQQDGHRLEIAAGESHLLVLVRVAGARIFEQPVAARYLAVHRLAHPVGKMAVVLPEVRERRGDMGKPFEVLRGGLELHVDEDHDEAFRRMGQRYAVAQRQEVLRLPRTRGADHYRVEAVSAEVLGAHDDVLELSAGFHPDGDHRPARVTPAAALSPQSFHIECARVADPQRPQQCFALPPIFGQVRGGRRRPTGQGAREAVGRALGEHVRNRERRTSMVQATLAHVEDLVFAGETDTRSRPGRQAQHGDAGHPLLTGHTLPLVGGAGVVVDDDPVRAQWHRRGRLQGRRGVRRTRTVRRRPRPAPLPMQFGVQRILEVGRRGEHQTAQAARVEHLVVLVVRQPHQPRPTLGMARHDHQLDVAGTVINRQRAQHRPHHGVQFGDVTDEAEPGSGPQTEHFADIGDGPLREHEVAEGATGDRFEFLTDRDLRPLQRRSRVRRGLHADAQAHVQEVRIGRPTLPHPRSADDGVELLWVAVDEGTVPAVLPRGPLHLVAILVEPPQV